MTHSNGAIPRPTILAYKTETDSTAIKQVFCISLCDPNRPDQIHRFADGVPGLEPLCEAAHLLDQADMVVSHNPFHRKALETRFSLDLDGKYFDTWQMAMARLPGISHKLEDWSARLRIPYGPSRGNKHWTPALANRCDNGLRIICKLYEALMAEGPA